MDLALQHVLHFFDICLKKKEEKGKRKIRGFQMAARRESNLKTCSANGATSLSQTLSKGGGTAAAAAVNKKS